KHEKHVIRYNLDSRSRPSATIIVPLSDRTSAQVRGDMSAKPIILTVDDDASVLSAIARDLRRQYGERYRIVRAESGEAALEALGELTARNDPVALLLVDQRMPRMNGVEFLKQAMAMVPDAKRVL